MNDWRYWGGGNNPVNNYTIVDVKFGSGDIWTNQDSWRLDWQSKGRTDSIISYRVRMTCTYPACLCMIKCNEGVIGY